VGIENLTGTDGIESLCNSPGLGSRLALHYTPPAVGIEESNDEYRTPNYEFRLFQNLPNPFSKLTAISYQIPLTPFNKGGQRGIPVRLAIYDITGRLVKTLVDERQEPGIYQVEWDGKNQSSGIYFFRLQTRIGQAVEFTSTRKLIFLR
jgi:hypothetical protein